MKKKSTQDRQAEVVNMDSKRIALVGLDLEVFIWLCNDYKEKSVV